MKNSIISLVSFSVFFNCAFAQLKSHSFEQLLNELYSKNTITKCRLIYNITKDYVKISDLENGNWLEITKDTNIQKTRGVFIINGSKIDSVYTGNENFDISPSEIVIDTSNSFSFCLNKKKYAVISLIFPNCYGSFCRIYSCLFISYSDKSIFYFSNQESPPNNYFRINNLNKIVFLEVDNSFSNPNGFKKWIKNEDDTFFYYKITSLEFVLSSLKWSKEILTNGIEKQLVIKTKSQFEKVDFIKVESNWK